ncbi:hypothetical protein UT300005_19640 [Clostridium sp. CTA-5]
MESNKENINLYNQFLKYSYSELKELFNKSKTKEEQDFYMSMAKVDDIENKLSELNCYSEINRDEIVKIILSVIYKKYSNNEMGIVKAIKCTDTLLIHTNLSYEDEYYDLYGLDDSYYLAQNGTYGDLDEVAIQFKDAISRYESYWKKFKESIDKILG